MATLDYALLAEYARVDAAGLITIVGGSFDRIEAAESEGIHRIYVALRVLADESEAANPVPVEIRVLSPGDYQMAMSTRIRPNPSAEPFDGHYNITLAVGLNLPLPVAGRYVIQVSIDGRVARDLPFNVALIPAGQ